MSVRKVPLALFLALPSYLQKSEEQLQSTWF